MECRQHFFEQFIKQIFGMKNDDYKIVIFQNNAMPLHYFFTNFAKEYESLLLHIGNLYDDGIFNAVYRYV
jgi:hypothetical protein